MTKQEKAIGLHDKGCNCAQAVACAFAEEIGVPEETLFAAAEGFGLGMGGMEATCGAVSGAVMLAGFKNSCADPKNPKTKAATYQLTREITRQFAEKNHALVCKELKGAGNRRGFAELSGLYPRCGCDRGKGTTMNSDEFILEVPVELPICKKQNTTMI